MTMNSPETPSVVRSFRELLMPWGFALLLPMPMLLASSDSRRSDVATLYLALGAAWLAAEAFNAERRPKTLGQWRVRMFTLAVCLTINAGVFTALGWAAGVEGNIPLPILAALGIAPALGLVPWLTLRLNQPYAAIILAGLTVGVMKIAGCVVARVVYGLDFASRGYIAADWHTARLMISIMWGGTLVASLAALCASRRQFLKATL
jgi:hypothetical protein